MDPGVVSDWPGRCGICNMALVRRKRGEALALPDGVIARMQLSPYRIQLAGIQTTPATFQPLEREFESSGLVSRLADSASVAVEIPARQAPWVDVGRRAKIVCGDLPGREPMAGLVRSLDRRSTNGYEYFQTTITILAPPPDLRGGMIAIVKITIPVAALEPFHSMPSDPPRLSPGDARVVYLCADHPEKLAVATGTCSIDRKPLESRSLSDYERLRWWCPMHPRVTAERAGSVCQDCGGMALVPRLISFAPAGQVLTVPVSSVVDGGGRKVIFVESMPGMFDGVEVVLGPRCGDSYPVVRGLAPGQRVAFAGAFLLDAETRLNPSLAAAYFGAGRGQRVPPAVQNASETKFSGLSPQDRALAEQQKFCPVADKPLGTMGTPVRIVVDGQVVFLCCDGCEDAIRQEPAKFLSKLQHAH
jgi:hypothetical protein